MGEISHAIRLSNNLPITFFNGGWRDSAINSCLSDLIPRSHMKEAAMVWTCNLDLGEAKQVNKSLDFLTSQFSLIGSSRPMKDCVPKTKVKNS